MVRNIKSTSLEKRMEKEQSAVLDNAKEEPIKTTKYIIMIFSFVGIYKAYNEGTLFQNLFPYTLLGLYDNFIYTRYTICNSFLNYFIKFSKFFYKITFAVVVLGYFNFIKLQNSFIVILFENEEYEFIRAYYLFIWIFIYYILMGVEIFLPLKRGEIK